MLSTVSEQTSDTSGRLGRPATLPRLDQISSDVFVEALAERVRDRVKSVGLPIEYGGKLVAGVEPLARGVFGYAVTGQVGAGVVPSDSTIGEVVDAVDRAVTGREVPFHDRHLHGLGSDSVAHRIDSILGVVFLAATARLRLDAGLPISVAHLAALSGSARSGIRAATNAGKLKVAARDEKRGNGRDFALLSGPAIRWLKARKVPGFGDS